ncbi:unnamed protein product [Caenorhabditis sp. 36 PRJEB53466]|nr:unnamed protein product [Caenorhabditis sp. 36 PRJEB53466]
MQNSDLSMFLHPQTSLANHKLPSTQQSQFLAQVLIETLQNWCMQLFWMTVFCVMNCCGDEEQPKSQMRYSAPAAEYQPKNRIEDIEKKMLRHLTSPMIAGPLRPVRTLKRRISSKPPSAQLFDIMEEE